MCDIHVVLVVDSAIPWLVNILCVIVHVVLKYIEGNEIDVRHERIIYIEIPGLAGNAPTRIWCDSCGVYVCVFCVCILWLFGYLVIYGGKISIHSTRVFFRVLNVGHILHFGNSIKQNCLPQLRATTCSIQHLINHSFNSSGRITTNPSTGEMITDCSPWCSVIKY